MRELKPNSLRRICIVGLDDYPLLSGHEAGEAPGGGEAVQHALLARAWRDLGLDVTVIVRDHGQPADITIDGIRLVSAFAAGEGIRGLRFFHPRMTGLWRALTRADADVYYQSPASVHTGITAAFCRRHRRLFIARIASDANCIPGQQLIRFWRDRKLYEYGLRSADLIVAQTQRQRELLERHYRLGSVVIDMAVEPPSAAWREVSKDIDVLWVGNLREVKRPELALDIARRLPQLRFTFVGGPLPGRKAYYQRIAAAAGELPNVTFVGAVPYGNVDGYFDRARLLLNTSSLEGFPNTFLQAWIRGIPVVSSFDPDGLIGAQQLGARFETAEQAVAALSRWCDREDDRLAVGERARTFAGARYDALHVANRYLEHLRGERLRVLQLGPALEVRGGVAAVERLLLEATEERVDMRHLPTMAETGWLRRIAIFSRAVVALRRELKRAGTVTHIHFASRGSTVRKFILAELVLRKGRPLVLHAHGAAFDTFHRRRSAWVRAIINRTLSRADILVALSSQWRRFFIEECGVSAERVVILANPVRLPAAVPRRSARSSIQFLFLGRIGVRKGAHDLVAAFGKLPATVRDHARLVLAGDGDGPELRRRVIDECIEIRDWVTPVQRDELLAASDVLVLPSYQEGLPMAVLEAMAWGLPVIVSPVGGIPDVVTDGREGIIVPAGDVAALCEAMRRLADDGRFRARAGVHARYRAEGLDVRLYVDRLLGVYADVATHATARTSEDQWRPHWITMRSRG